MSSATEPFLDEVVGGCPLDCPDGCSWVVTRKNGVPVRLRGNPQHPFTQGGLCGKVNSYLDHTRHPDRLLHPLRRTGPKGSGRFERISWDDALDEWAIHMRSGIDTHGPETVLPFVGTGTVGLVQGPGGLGQRLFGLLGSSRSLMTICSVAGHRGMSYTTGSAAGMDPADLRHSSLILLWGTNTLTSNQHLWPFIEAGRANGAHVVVIDPTRTRTARRADEHIAVLPGSDSALALALMHVVVREGGADATFLAENTLGWPEFARSLDRHTPARAAERCGIPVETIEALGVRIAASRPTGIRLSMGMQRHFGGGQATRVISCIPAVTGDYHRLGGGACYSTGPAYFRDRANIVPPGVVTRSRRGVPNTRIGHALLDLDDPPVTSLFISGANPMASNPDTDRVRRGLERDDLHTVVVDHFLTDTARYADIVLPGTMQTEHFDLHDSFSHLSLQLNVPATEPAGECLSGTEILRRLARRLGVTHPAVLADDEALARDAVGTPVAGGFDELLAKGWARLDVPSPFIPFADGFPTASGRFEFTSERAEVDGHGRLPHDVGPYEPGDGERLQLVAAASHHFLNSTFANRELHAGREGELIVTLHPEDAGTRGLVDGERVEVANDRGAFTARLVVSDTARPGVAVSVKGHWPSLSGGANVNATVLEADGDMGQGAVFHDNLVQVSAASGC
jgi:anaerobic selenocysteine-containing dehydrogenase